MEDFSFSALWHCSIPAANSSSLGLSSQGYGFSSGHVWMQELDCEESWGPKNWCFWTVVLEKTLRIDAFELWYWRRLLRAPWIARRSNQSILKEISPGCSLEGMMLKLKLQDFGHLMRRVDSLEKTLMLGGIGDRRRRGQQRMRWLDGITNSMDVSFSELTGRACVGQGGLACCNSWGRKESDTTEWLNWTELNWTELYCENQKWLQTSPSVPPAIQQPRGIGSSLWEPSIPWEENSP